jgi:hypothetical protein
MPLVRHGLRLSVVARVSSADCAAAGAGAGFGRRVKLGSCLASRTLNPLQQVVVLLLQLLDLLDQLGNGFLVAGTGRLRPTGGWNKRQDE